MQIFKSRSVEQPLLPFAILQPYSIITVARTFWTVKDYYHSIVETKPAAPVSAVLKALTPENREIREKEPEEYLARANRRRERGVGTDSTFCTPPPPAQTLFLTDHLVPSQNSIR